MQLRRLQQEDMEAAARLHRLAFDHRLPWLAGLHTPQEDLAFFRGHVFRSCLVWGVFREADLAAFIAFRDGWIDHLYVRPEAQRQGIGGRLLTIAQEAQSDLLLWTFRRNRQACRFYESHGFMIVDETDGSGNLEREPDLLFRWVRKPAETGVA